MVPRVLIVRASAAGAVAPVEPVEVETVAVHDGDTALARLRAERFDAVVVDLALAPLDGWCVLATVGAWRERPRLTAIVADAAERDRARRLGADTCLSAGTRRGVGALSGSTDAKETPTPWRAPLTTSSRPTTPVGASA